jgi:hypothetical protein
MSPQVNRTSSIIPSTTAVLLATALAAAIAPIISTTSTALEARAAIRSSTIIFANVALLSLFAVTLLIPRFLLYTSYIKKYVADDNSSMSFLLLYTLTIEIIKSGSRELPLPAK